MALFNESYVRNRAKAEMQRPQNIYKSNSKILMESAVNFSKSKSYDIFLSHSSKDAELILGMKGIIEDHGYTVYVDWIDDAQLDRSKVDRKTAIILKERMASSKSLFFVTTTNSVNSKWMPWECGYFDGLREKVAIVPVIQNSISDEYNGQEYLGLYPYCLQANNTNKESKLWIHLSKDKFITFDIWVKSPNNLIQWRTWSNG